MKVYVDDGELYHPEISCCIKFWTRTTLFLIKIIIIEMPVIYLLSHNNKFGSDHPI